MSQILWFDFTDFGHDQNKDIVIELLTKHAFAWAFQQEECPSTGKLHFQGRMKLKNKERLNTLIKKGTFETFHLSATTNEKRGNFDYCTKDDSRVDGPWTSEKDIPKYMPRQWRLKDGESLYPFQQKLIDDIDNFDARTINFVYCPTGNSGKSFICGRLTSQELAFSIPIVKDYQVILQAACSRYIKTAVKPKLILIDMPRAIDNGKMPDIFASLETLKNGYAWDTRHNFKDVHFDSPNIWVFSNHLPPLNCMSLDRWKFWEIIDKDFVAISIEQVKKIQANEVKIDESMFRLVDDDTV